MIKGILGELAAEEETTEAQGNFEEEGSSSAPRKEDGEDKRATVEVKLSVFHLNK